MRVLLPDWQYDEVFLYQIDSDLGVLIRAVREPTERGVKALSAAASEGGDGPTLNLDRLDEALTAVEDARALITEVLGREAKK